MAKKSNRALRSVRLARRGRHDRPGSPEHRGQRSLGAADQITRALRRAQKEQGDGG